MVHKLKTWHSIGLLIALAVVSHLVWFNLTTILTSTDWHYWPATMVKQLWYAWGTWSSFQELGSPNIQMPFLFFNSIWSLIANLGLSFDVATKITFFIPIALLGFLAPYWYIKALTKDELISLVAAVFYGTTTYFLMRQTAHLPIAFIYALSPLMLLSLKTALDTGSYRQWVLFAGLFSVGIFYEVRIMYILTFILLGYAIGLRLKRTLANWRQILVASSLILGLNIFWLLPTLFGKLASDIAGTTSETLFGNKLFNVAHAIANVDWSWTGTLPDNTFTIQSIPLYAWAIPAFLWFGIAAFRRYFHRDEARLILFFAVLSLIGILLSKQVDQPFESAYPWLFQHFPGFRLFREASKFFLLITLGYLGLITFALVGLKRWAVGRRAWVFGLGSACIVALAVLNLRPILNGEIRTLFISRTRPVDYDILERFSAGKAYFRTLWAPQETKWAPFDIMHPEIQATSATPQLIIRQSLNGIRQHNIANFLKSNVAPSLLSAMSVRYIAIPSFDIANDNNIFQSFGNDRDLFLDTLNALPWLQRVDLGTKEVAVYENKAAKPYLSALTQVFNLESLEGLSDKYAFVSDALKTEFAFTGPKNAAPKGVGLDRLFESPARTDVASGTITASAPASPATLYMNTNHAEATYRMSGPNLVITTHQRGGLSADGRPLLPAIDQAKPASITALKPTGEYMVGVGDTLMPVNPADATERNLGIPAAAPVVYSVDAINRVNAPKFENGLWRQNVEDCNPYDSNKFMGMNLVTDDDKLERVLELTADHHTACTGPDAVAVRAGERLLVQFDYRVQQGKEAGYVLEWGGGAAALSPTRGYLPVTSIDWHTLHTAVTVPAGATTLRLKLEAFPNEQKPVEGIVRYTNVRLSGLTTLARAPINVTPSYQSVALPAGTHTLSVTQPGLSGQNLIANPSLEAGLWQKQVGDCNAHDNRAALSQRLTSNKTDGRQALELAAKRHIACTGPPPVTVQEGHTYLLSFDYQSPNAASANYAVSFNNPDRGRVDNTGLVIKDKAWHTLNQTFTVPYGATQASISVSAYSEEEPGTRFIVNRYDNFRLVEIPAVAGQYYSVSQPGPALTAPAHIGFEALNPTKKLVHITGATTPFYLAMSEAYHPRWRLELNNAQVQGLHSWLPGGHPSAIAAANHFKLDDFLNAWYVDPAVLCGQGAGCVRHSDGSYDLELMVEFVPQRWFYLGGLMSLATLIVALLYLLWAWRRRSLVNLHKSSTADGGRIIPGG